VGAVADVWHEHRRAARRRSVARLKMIAVIERPKTIPLSRGRLRHGDRVRSAEE
jgi:hypothetical protein